MHKGAAAAFSVGGFAAVTLAAVFIWYSYRTFHGSGGNRARRVVDDPENQAGQDNGPETQAEQDTGHETQVQEDNV